jgi:hypothetical protein
MNKCLNCQKEVKNKFCNVSCQNYYQKKGIKFSEETILRRNKTLKSRWKNIVVNCFICSDGFSIKQRDSDIPRKDKYFCSRKCACVYSSNVNKENKNIKISSSMKGNPKVIESSRKAGLATREKSERIKINVNCLLCNEAIETKNPKRKYHSSCWTKISGGIKKGSSRGKCGWYKGYWCDSSYELAYVIYNIDHKIPFERNLEGFEYEYQGKVRKFYPDFIVNKGYVEIKNFKSEQTDSKISQFPHQIRIFYKEYMIENIISYVISKYGKNFIELYEK